jgi:hypothetical protein
LGSHDNLRCVVVVRPDQRLGSLVGPLTLAQLGCELFLLVG